MFSRRLLLLIPILFLEGISVTMLQSIAPSQVISQVMYVVFGFFVLVSVSLLSPNALLKLVPFTYFLTIIGLVLTFLIGKLSHGAIRWIPLGPIHIQVSEFAKPIVAVMTTWYVREHKLKKQKDLLYFFIILGVPTGLVFLQPDLGSALVLACIGFVALFFTSFNIKLLVPWLIALLLITGFSWKFVLYQYQRDRLTTFVMGSKASDAKNYNARQALIAVGSGKVSGRGLGHGVQSNLKFLPERYTDFMFASLAEELGFFGVIVVLFLYLFLFYNLFSLGSRTVAYASICILSLTISIFFQMLVNIGMNIGLFPITGITLPFLSSGGSSIVSLCLSMGIIISFSRLVGIKPYIPKQTLH